MSAGQRPGSKQGIPGSIPSKGARKGSPLPIVLLEPTEIVGETVFMRWAEGASDSAGKALPRSLGRAVVPHP